MRAGPVIKAASGGMSRRRAQTVVIFMVLLVSTAAATLGLGLLVAADQPFQHAFAAQRGAHVAAVIDSSRTTDDQLAATGRLPGVTRSAGPFGSANITFVPPNIGPGGPGGPSGSAPPPVSATVVGRSSAGGPLDDLSLRSGRWVQRPGEIVLAEGDRVPDIVGSKITVSSGRGKPQLTVVGMASSITGSADGWVVPAEVAALRAPGAPAGAQMLYRFAAAGSAAKIHTDVATVTSALPAGAVVSTASWLAAEQQSRGTSSIIAPFVVAFAIMGLAMSVLIVANVISGAVVAGYRRIGVLKSIGFSPAQVVGAYVAWVAVPAVTGCLIGVGLGNLLALPVLHDSSDAFNVGSQSIPPWIDVVAPLAMCALAGLAALLPALRAGRLSAVAAIATGQAPRQNRGYAAHRLLGRLRMPRPVTIGLAAPFARPARTAVTLAAIAFGATAVVFAVGLDTSLVRVAAAQARTGIGEVNVLVPPGQRPGGDLDRKVVAAIRSQPGTQHYVAEAMPSVTVPGLGRQVNANAFRGDSAWTRLSMISGRWYRADGEVDVNTAFLTLTGRSVGDIVPITTGGRLRTARIVGEIFQPDREPVLYGGWQTLGGTAAGLTVDQYGIALRPGISRSSYSAAMTRLLGNDLPIFTMQRGQKFELTAVSLISLLTLMMAVVAGLGVLNTVLLSTRERVHDLGVFKAVGMTPRQTIAMVVCWIVGPALAATVIAAPVAVILHTAVLHAMAHAADTALPAHVLNAYGPVGIVVVALSGVVIAVAGALAPASWAAGAKTATALRAE